MTQTPREFLLLTKTDEWSRHACDLAGVLLEGLTTHSGSSQDALPAGLTDRRWSGILSFLSPWIIPQTLLQQAPIALNFHPGSAEYPGIGCYNFALYEGAGTFGAVCHHMLPQVDTGAIVAERRFPVRPNESVESLKLRTMVEMLGLFHDIVLRLAHEEPLPHSDRTWTRRPFRRSELNALGVITPEMDPDEVNRRVRAMTYPGHEGARLDVNGQITRWLPPDRTPIA